MLEEEIQESYKLTKINANTYSEQTLIPIMKKREDQVGGLFLIRNEEHWLFYHDAMKKALGITTYIITHDNISKKKRKQKQSTDE